MKRSLALICGLAALLLTCSEKSTNPPNDNPPVDSTFSISYTADESQAIEQYVTAQVGGTIVSSDARGVEFELTIPPSALPADTAIKVTPLASMTLGGITGDVCTNCTGADSQCCLHGILLEPAGLVLDSAATLTITFPAGQYPFAQGGWIAYIDSAGGRYNICRTAADTINYTLVAGIRHFSGYASDDPRYDRLEADIYDRAELLEASIGTGLFDFRANDLLSLYPAFECHGSNCPDFSDLYQTIESILLDCWTQEVDHVRQGAGTDCDGLESLSWLWTALQGIAYDALNNRESFESLEASLMGDILAMLPLLANQGKQACDEGRCDEGREKLRCVRQAIADLGLTDQYAELYAHVMQWLLYCCTFTADMTVMVTHEGGAIWLFEDSIDIEFSFIIAGDTVDGAGLGTHDVTMTIYPEECALGDIIAENFPQPMAGEFNGEFLDLTFPGFEAETYPVNVIIVCGGYPVQTPFFGGLESEAIRRCQPHLLLQDGATDSGSGSFGDTYPIQYSYEITLHVATE